MASQLIARITATDSALLLLAKLREKYGPLMLFQAGSCYKDCATLCYPLGEFSMGSEVYLGNLEGAPFYVEHEQFENWVQELLVVDAINGAGASGSLDYAVGKHFCTRSRVFKS
jgi:uncharacterized protein (DUF779 family)